MHTSYGLLTSGGGGASSGRGPPKDLWDQHREWFWCAQQLSLSLALSLSLLPTFWKSQKKPVRRPRDDPTEYGQL